MLETSFDVQLRPATVEDAEIVADLDTLREPDDPRDPVVMRHWWATLSATECVVRWVAVRDGTAIACVTANHVPWTTTTLRYGSTRPRLHPDMWTEARFDELIEVGEAWLRSEGVTTGILRSRDTLPREQEVAERRGYREARRSRISELDLALRRENILRTAVESRRQMLEQGIELLVLSDDHDPDKVDKLYRLEVDTERDIPTTVPIPVLDFEPWKARRYGDPSVREDRVWLAREGDALVGLSQLGYPVVRGTPFTDYTATSRTVRGRGIARALKYQTMAQAIELGFTRVRTQNDGANAPMLHINEEMGYRLVATEIELHRDLRS
jgi:RimJ/RimL family protein N-acetyltransferase